MINSQNPHLGMHSRAPLKEKPVLDTEETMGMLGASLIKLLEIFIMGIQALHHLKTKYLGAQNSK